MDAYDRCTNLGEKNLADIVAIYGRDRKLYRPPMYTTWRLWYPDTDTWTERITTK